MKSIFFLFSLFFLLSSCKTVEATIICDGSRGFLYQRSDCKGETCETKEAHLCLGDGSGF